MSDVVERLRSQYGKASARDILWIAGLLREAADEIERLRMVWAGAAHELEIADAEIERLRTALRESEEALQDYKDRWPG